jgi:hypothetical protein
VSYLMAAIQGWKVDNQVGVMVRSRHGDDCGGCRGS